MTLLGVDKLRLQQDRLFPMAFALCAAASLIPIWTVHYLPMTDFPQHALQTAILRFYNDPVFGYQDHYVIRWFTPYITVFLFGAALAFLMPLFVAMKVVLSVAVVGLPAALWLAIRETGGDRWWALLGFPLSFGYSFYWGFFSYQVAIPIAVLQIALGLRWIRVRSWKAGAAVSACSIGLFFTHPLAFAIASIICAFIILEHSRHPLSPFILGAPFLAAAPFVLAWHRMTSANQWLFHDRSYDLSSGVDKIRSLPAALLSMPGDAIAHIGGIALFGLVFLGAGKPARLIRRLAPAVAVTILYYKLPSYIFGANYIYERTAIFVPLTLILGLVAARGSFRLTAIRSGVFVFCLGWMVFVSVKFHKFNAQASHFKEIVAAMPESQRVIAYLESTSSTMGTHLQVVHFPAWYQVAKGGRTGYDFARFYISLVGRKEGAGDLAAIHQPSFAPDDPFVVGPHEVERYDYVLVRSLRRRPTWEHRLPMSVLVLEKSAGNWHLYRKMTPAAETDGAAGIEL